MKAVGELIAIQIVADQGNFGATVGAKPQLASQRDFVAELIGIAPSGNAFAVDSALVGVTNRKTRSKRVGKSTGDVQARAHCLVCV